MIADRFFDAGRQRAGLVATMFESTRQRDAVLAALNGLIGDQLANTGNVLAIPMCLRQRGQPLPLERAALAAAMPAPGVRLVVLVHGLCCNDLQWLRRNHDHGVALARDLGYVPLYLYYNSGRHVSTNGQELSMLLDTLLDAWPVSVEELAILAHSMGGLVARSACHYARMGGRRWLGRLRQMVFLGVPHHGAPLARHGNWLGSLLGSNPLTAPLARLGELRSAGITDLRYGNLLDEDWRGRNRFAHEADTRRHVPLPRGIRCYTIAGSTGKRPTDLRHRLLGDGLIPVDAALGRHAERARQLNFPASRQWVAFDTHHLDLLCRVEVYEKIRAWLGEAH